MEILLGIDGGGTGTRAVLLDETGRVLGVGRAGPSNYHNVGLAQAAASLEAATAAAWAAAGLPVGVADHAFVGVAAMKSRLDRERMQDAASGLARPGALLVASDALNALAGGLGGAPGIAVISGTGVNVVGRDSRGAERACDGWGWLLGDRGSGFALGAGGLRAAARAADGRGPATRLVDAALSFFTLQSMDDLPARLHGREWSPGDVAAFAPLVLRFAQEGDAVAASVVREEAELLAETVATIAGQLHFPEGPSVVLVGGCVAPGSFFRDATAASVLRRLPSARLLEPRLGPLHGAALNVLRLAGRTSTAPMIFPE